MTRRFILTTATLAAFLAAGAPLATATPSARRPQYVADLAGAHVPSPSLLTIGDHLVAVHPFGLAKPGDDLAVAVFLESGSPSLRLWAGRKNGWGSLACRSEPVVGSSGLHLASVTIPEQLPDQVRLWIGLDRVDGRPCTGSVVLPLA